MESVGTAEFPGIEFRRKMKSQGYYCNNQKKWIWRAYAQSRYETEELTRGAGLLN